MKILKYKCPISIQLLEILWHKHNSRLILKWIQSILTQNIISDSKDYELRTLWRESASFSDLFSIKSFLLPVSCLCTSFYSIHPKFNFVIHLGNININVGNPKNKLWVWKVREIYWAEDFFWSVLSQYQTSLTKTKLNEIYTSH